MSDDNNPRRDPAQPGQPSKLLDYWTSYLAGLGVIGIIVAVVGALAAGFLVLVLVLGLLAVTGILKWLLIAAVVAVPVGIWVHLNHEATPPAPLVREFSRPTGSPFGDAGWAYEQEIDAFGLVPMQEGAWTRGIWLGRAINVEWSHGLGNPMANKYLRYAGENNIVTFSSAGGGKNAAAVMPTLLVNNESAFVNDMKGENWFVTARTRAELFGHRIVCLNPFNLYGKELGFAAPMTAHFNPLSKLRPAQPDFVANINTLADALIVSGEAKDPHWSDRARQLCAGLMAHLCAVADDPEIAAEVRAWLNVPAHVELNSLPAMRQALGLESDDLAAFCLTAVQGRPEKVLQDTGEVLRALPASTVPLVRDNLASFAANTKEVGGIISTALGQLSFLTEPALIDFLAFSDFDFSDLRRELMTVYCMVPPAYMDTYYRFVRVLVQACFNTLSGSPISERAPVLMLLDEQAKLGGMNIIKTSAATLRGYNVRIWSIFQDLNQVKGLYPDVWETFLANAGVIQVMTVNDAVTANYFSDKIGRRGVTTTSTSFTRSSGTTQSGATSGTSSSTSTSEQGQPFLTPQDFYNLSKGLAVVFVQGLAYPVKVERLEYWKQQDQYGQPNVFLPWGTVCERHFLPYTPNPEHDPAILASERARLAMVQAVADAKAEGRALSSVVATREAV